jgi:hypothetical protein
MDDSQSVQPISRVLVAHVTNLTPPRECVQPYAAARARGRRGGARGQRQVALRRQPRPALRRLRRAGGGVCVDVSVENVATRGGTRVGTHAMGKHSAEAGRALLIDDDHGDAGDDVARCRCDVLKRRWRGGCAAWENGAAGGGAKTCTRK